MAKKLLSLLLVVVMTASIMAISVVSTSAATNTFKVTASSNFFPTSVSEISKDAKQIKVTYYLKSAKDLLNSEWFMYYDPSVLSPKAADNNGTTICPEIGSKAIYKLDASGKTADTKSVKYSAINISLYDFSTEKKVFASVVFDVISSAPTDTTVDLYVHTIGVSKRSASGVTIPSEEEYIVDYGVKTSSTVSTETSSEIKDLTDGAFLTVNTTSNYFPSTTTKYDESTKQITVTFMFQSPKAILDSQWFMYYDPNVLSPSAKNNNPMTVCPTIGTAAGPLSLAGSGLNEGDGLKSIRYSASSLYLFDFSKANTVFAKVVFDVVTTVPATTSVFLNVDILRVSALDEDTYMTDKAQEEALVLYYEVLPTNLKINLTTEATPSTYKEEEQLLMGDVNEDGVVSIMDATEIQKYIAELVNLTDRQKKVADTNGDGDISIMDVTEIQKFIAELVDHLG